MNNISSQAIFSRIVASAFLVLFATACFPGEAPLERFDDFSELIVVSHGVIDANVGETSGYTVIFALEDSIRLGIPVENEMLARTGGRAEARIPMTEFFIEQIDTAESLIDLGCIETIDIRNDTTSEVVLTVRDFCPAVSDTSFSLNVSGVIDPNKPLGWAYQSKEGLVEVYLDQPIATTG